MPYDKLSLKNRTAVVIGGTTGIGRALALGLAEAGATVVASSRRPSEVENVSQEIEQRGARTLREVSDVTDRASLQRLLDRTLEQFDKVDILVNCAGFTKRGPTLDFA
jgi:NAD(P)-dependent dehydrogenase (short-subunit alcohol dehydrogenase family)